MNYKEIVGAVGSVLLAGLVTYGYVRGVVTGEQLLFVVAALGLPSPLPLLHKLLGKKNEVG